MSDDKGEPGRAGVVRHHRAELVFGLVAFLTALLLASQLGTQLTWQSGRAFIRQPGFMTTVSILGMLLFGAGELYFCWRRNQASGGRPVLGEIVYWLTSVEYAGWFMAYVLLVPVIGYLPVTLAFCLLLVLRLGYRNRRILVASLLVGLTTVVIFKSFLAVKIPGSAVYEMLPPALRNFMILYL